MTPAEMRELHAKTTPGEWRRTYFRSKHTITANGLLITPKITMADGDFTAAAHNHLPALLDRIEELERAAEWKTRDEAPVTMDFRGTPRTDKRLTVLFWGPSFSDVRSGELARIALGDGTLTPAHGSIPSRHGCAFDDWGATHWRYPPPPPALPSPPKEPT